jgi:hypothetical protein
VFSAEDYKRRVKWGEAAGRACDAVSVSGSHLRDWTPHRVTAEPVLQTVKPGGKVTVTLTVAGTSVKAEDVTLHVAGRGLLPDIDEKVRARPGQGQTMVRTVTVAAGAAPGRMIFPVSINDSTGREPVDTFFAVDVEK